MTGTFDSHKGESLCTPRNPRLCEANDSWPLYSSVFDHRSFPTITDPIIRSNCVSRICKNTRRRAPTIEQHPCTAIQQRGDVAFARVQCIQRVAKIGINNIMASGKVGGNCCQHRAERGRRVEIQDADGAAERFLKSERNEGRPCMDECEGEGDTGHNRISSRIKVARVEEVGVGWVLGEECRWEFSLHNSHLIPNLKQAKPIPRPSLLVDPNDFILQTRRAR
ncbi:hypothetical protein BT96DRAFT_989372 [Gymnopus androsaceus JB14]|uniref:Uncharacterized protein n=1 Tax=Gymnopus androsaceus JB14 TaxID=1447944 RepID=A0A6A4I1Q7_9AGAR|nr:hypothetical protein BT96DRAFT_989372 [Gymnopus androsaceus JB14]